MRTKYLGVAAVLLAGVTLTACGSSKAIVPAQDLKAGSAVGQATTSTTAAPVAPTSAVLKVVEDPALGSIIQDGSGNTLYAFTNDTDGKSVCNDACATTWPPTRVTDNALNAPGIDQSLLTTITRADGTTQLALNKWPLYRFAADGTGTGTTKGQGSKGVWFVLNAEGKLVKTVPATATPAPSPAPAPSNSATPAPAAPTLAVGTLAAATVLPEADTSSDDTSSDGKAFTGVGSINSVPLEEKANKSDRNNGKRGQRFLPAGRDN